MTATEELLSQKLAAQHQNAVLLEENTRLRAENVRLQAIVNPLCELHGCTAELVVEWCKRDAAEVARLREALIKLIGSLGLLIKGANPSAPGHTQNLEDARKVIAETATEDELLCPTCRSSQWAELYPSKSDPTGYTLYCRRCEEGCVSPARAVLEKEGKEQK